jgi:imidazolonepropionase-like amidohydrolase
MTRPASLLALLLLLPSAALAARPTVLRAQRLFDARSGKVVSPGVVLVRDGRIEAVGSGTALPKDVEVVDLGDATLLPGLIDAHVHLDSERSDDYRQDQLDSLQKPVAELALEAGEHARRTLRAGFTTVRNLGSAHVIDIGLRNAARSGMLEGPRVIASGAALGATGGHCDTHGFREGALAEESAGGVADGPDALRGQVRKALKYGADVIKVCVTGGVLSEGDDVDVPQLTQAEMDAAVDEAHSLRKKVAVHAHGATGAKRAIKAGADSIEHGTFLDEEAFRMMAERNTVLIPTPLNQRIYDEQKARGAKFHPRVWEKIQIAAKARRESMRLALAKKVRIGFGTDAGVIPHGRNAEQLGILVEYGMSPTDALRAATTVNAELLGLSQELGSLEPGKVADVIAVPGDVLRDVRATERVFFVMKEGRVVRHDAAPTTAAMSR